MADLAHSYRLSQKADGFSPQESQTWSELSAIVGPGCRLDPATEAELRKSLSVARGREYLQSERCLPARTSS
jgi:hypothetical protein